MLTFLRRFFISLLSLIVLLGIFIIWGSSSQYEEDSYTKITSFGEQLAKDTTDSTYRIITYNIGYLSDSTNNRPLERFEKLFDASFNQVYKAFKGYNPDFIAYQEIDFASSRSFKVNQFEELGKKMGFASGAMAVNWDKKYVPFPYFPPSVNFGEMFSGQGIHSKYKIDEQERLVLERADNPFWYDAFYIERLAQVAKIQLDSQQLVIINVHLEAFDSLTRVSQIPVVLDLFRKYSKDFPTILLGDFNSEPPLEGEKKTAITLLLEEAGMGSACPPSSFRRKESMTYPARGASQQIDYIFYNTSRIEAINWKVISEVGGASDHLPLLMEFKIK